MAGTTELPTHVKNSIIIKVLHRMQLQASSYLEFHSPNNIW
jgi:hypothetical protein